MFLFYPDTRNRLRSNVGLPAVNHVQPRGPGFARKGRGAVGNPGGRYERLQYAPADDGWFAEPDEVAPPVRTSVTSERCRTILSRNNSPDVPFDRSINPYRGCEHGCTYCFARPTHAYLGLSPGLEFETRLFAKTNAAEVLEQQLRAPGYAARPIQLGANTDPYQPIERKLRLTRAILEVLERFNHPVAITTKSAGVVRDADILARMAGLRLAAVGVSLTTLDGRLARVLEPRASSPSRRLEAMRELHRRGIPVAVLVAPVIPFLNDSETEKILEAAAAAGVNRASYILLRLPHEVKELFSQWLDAHVPGRGKRVLAAIRSCRSGALYDATFGDRMRGTGIHAELLAKRFELACQRLGLGVGTASSASELDSSRFRPPGPRHGQLTLF
jgi:DNA repair photolyase